MAGFVDDDNTELVRGTDSRLLGGFLRKYLPNARVYQRAVGFFSSSIFRLAASEFESFFSKTGKIELICSPVFSEKDLETLFQAIYVRPAIRQSVEEIFANKGGQLSQQVLHWALANNRLAIRIAIVENQVSDCIYHEKIGVMGFGNGEFIAIEGSANESATAFRSNFERILLHRASKSNRHIWANTIQNDFERLWNNTTPGLQVISLHEAFVGEHLVARSTNKFIQFSKDEHKGRIMAMNAPAEILKLPPRLELRDYQESAIASWFENGGVGIYSMATGSGKTITALATLERLFKKVDPPLVIIIIAPYLNLVDQWIEEAKEFGLDPINCSGASQDWTALVDMGLYLNQSKERPILSLVTTNTTFSLDPFQRVLEKLSVRTVIVADEVHNMGARHLSRKLPKKVKLRLGLSATPERWMDEEGTKSIEDYFGKTVINFDLEDALSGPNPALCPYVYHPILVSLDDDETEEYMAITVQLARLMVNPSSENLSDAALSLLLRRARLIACAKEKMPAFRKAIYPYKDSRFNLVYCGDGRVEVDSASSSVSRQVPEHAVMRQVDAITRMLGNDLEMNVAKYTAETSKDDRRAILSDFSTGEKQALVAIRCLDEGVDIPQVRRAFILASSTNPRQFIQRRGRVLRRADGKDQAEIFDFVVIPPLDQLTPGSAEFKTMRNLVSREMARVVEFARLAVNGPQATGILRPVLSQLKLLHL